MLFTTGIFGEKYLQLGLGLIRSFAHYCPSSELHVFSDLSDFEHASEVVDFRSLYDCFGPFYGQGQRRNVFKFSLIRKLQERQPNQTICWIDCDNLVLDDISKIVKDNHICVISHGRRTEPINCGNGLVRDGASFVIGGFYCVPPGPYLEYMETLANERPSWNDQGDQRDSGDQIILNHLVAKHPERVKYLSDSAQHIFNLEICQRHPKVGDPLLKKIQLRDDAFFVDNKRIALFYWICNDLINHLQTQFRSFETAVAKRLNQFYQRNNEWRDTGKGLSSRCYASYATYCQHQAQKLKKNQVTSEYDRSWEQVLFSRLQLNRTRVLTNPRSRVLCLGARMGGEVRAFRKIGCNSIGIDLNPGDNNPDVIKGDMQCIPFEDKLIRHSVYQFARSRV